MKKKLSIVLVITIFALIFFVLNNTDYNLNSHDLAILKEVKNNITSVYTEIDDDKLPLEDWKNKLVSIYRDEVDFYTENQKSIELIENRNLKKYITEYYEGSIIRLKAQEERNNNNLDEFDKLVREYRDLIEPALEGLIEEFGLSLDINNDFSDI